VGSKSLALQPKFQKSLDLLVLHLNKRGETNKAQRLKRLKTHTSQNTVIEIIECLSHSNPWVRMAAVECLGTMGKKEAIRHLCGALSDHFRVVRGETVKSLGTLLTNCKKCPPALVRKLKDPDFLVRIEVAETLGKIGDSRVLPSLWEQIHDRSPLVRSYIAAAIGTLGTQKDAKKLRQNLSTEKSDEVKLGYYTALDDLGDEKILPQLLGILQSKDYRVRCATANTLSEFTLNNSNAFTILAELKRTLKGETTIAAKSALKECIGKIQKRFKKNA